MLTYKIYLNEDMSVRGVVAPFNLIQYSWQDTLLNVYIPKSIVEETQNISHAISITFSQIDREGNIINTSDNRKYLFDYVKGNIIAENIEYVLYSRLMPKQMTLFSGSIQKYQINMLTYVDEVLSSVSLSNLQEYTVIESTNIEDEVEEATDLEELTAQVNNVKARVLNVETNKQDKTDPNISVHTSSATVEERETTGNVATALNSLDSRLDTQEIINSSQQTDINDLKDAITINFRPLGTMHGTTQEPTVAEINAWLESQGITTLQLGDTIFYVGEVSGQTNTNYRCVYAVGNVWTWYQTSEIEVASNTDMGIMRGTLEADNCAYVITMQNGHIATISFKRGNTFVETATILNELADFKAGILNGTVKAKHSELADKDEDGNNIKATYQTKLEGATKQYVSDYALPRMFNDILYVDFANLVLERTMSGATQKPCTVATTSEVKVFEITHVPSNQTIKYDYELSKNNLIDMQVYVTSDINSIADFTLNVYQKDTADLSYSKLVYSQSLEEVETTINAYTDLHFVGNLTELGESVITSSATKYFTFEMYIQNRVSTSTLFTFLSNPSYQSKQSFSTTYQTIGFVGCGTLGEQYYTKATITRTQIDTDNAVVIPMIDPVVEHAVHTFDILVGTYGSQPYLSNGDGKNIKMQNTITQSVYASDMQLCDMQNAIKDTQIISGKYYLHLIFQAIVVDNSGTLSFKVLNQHEQVFPYYDLNCTVDSVGEKNNLTCDMEIGDYDIVEVSFYIQGDRNGYEFTLNGENLYIDNGSTILTDTEELGGLYSSKQGVNYVYSVYVRKAYNGGYNIIAPTNAHNQIKDIRKHIDDGLTVLNVTNTEISNSKLIIHVDNMGSGLMWLHANYGTLQITDPMPDPSTPVYVDFSGTQYGICKSGSDTVLTFGDLGQKWYYNGGAATITTFLSWERKGGTPPFYTMRLVIQSIPDFNAVRHTQILDLTYPVGSIYMSVNNTNPSTLFGGTWTQIQDTFLLSAGTNYAAGTTGGSATHTPSGSVTVNNHTLTGSEIPTFKFRTGHVADTDGIWEGITNVRHEKGTGVTSQPNDEGKNNGVYNGAYHTFEFGGGQGHNHTASFSGTSADTMPPYLVVYMWKRTA